ncbi:Hypothetical protein SMAX5B_013863 [Scophthalmus maximus]|uniref:Uncharacterized protein n=1 Tax=Scophthalmus maximus TaxID=52904 RepID=A0A2U9CGD6_SCOMX|nr:Hypothetical protein SMAX5B_013863 [Scophthalmus maximus]
MAQSPEGLQCLPAQSQEHGGLTRRPALHEESWTGAVEGHQHSNRTGICSCEEKQEEHYKSPAK